MGRLEQPVQAAPHLMGALVGSQVPLYVLDGRLQHVEPVIQLVERLSGDDELGFAQSYVRGALASLVVSLAAGSAAEPARTARRRPTRQRTAAPPAPVTFPQFRHGDKTSAYW